jgi:hypothetical protein
MDPGIPIQIQTKMSRIRNTGVESLPAHQAGPLDLLQGVQVGDLLVVDELVLLLGQLQLPHYDVTGVGQRL